MGYGTMWSLPCKKIPDSWESIRCPHRTFGEFADASGYSAEWESTLMTDLKTLTGASSGSETGPATPSHLVTMRVLIVDDESASRKMLAPSLTQIRIPSAQPPTVYKALPV